MGRPDIVVDLPFTLIQVLRLVHALAEAGCRIHVSPKDVHKLSELRKIFGLQYEVGGEGIPALPGLSIDHLKPEVRVGWVTRPLILPVAAFEYCRARWPEMRPVRVSFPGLPTSSRKKTINEWLKLSKLQLRIPEHVGELPHNDFLQRVSRKIARRLGVPHRHYVHSEGVKFVLSNEGREFPRKAWNVDYYSCLLESEFILCPDGDSGENGVAWTYRFFESMLCGAIPVVQNSCAAYEGFRFRHMGEPLGELQWTRADADYNFALAMERLTVPPDELRSEVNRLLAHPEAAPAGVVIIRPEKEPNHDRRNR